MPSLFKDVDKILYIDCDVIATASLAEFFNTDLTGKLAAVIKDTSCETNQKILGFKPDEIYFNSGVMLVNLEKFRQDGIEKKLFEVSAEGYDDQDSLNIVLKNQTVIVDDTWNWQGKAKNYKEKVPPKLIHFITAYKPHLTGLKTSFNKEYFKALKGTPWDNFYDQHLRRFLPVIHKDRKKNDIVSDIKYVRSSVKQELITQILNQIKGLSKLKKKGHKVGKLKFKSEFNSIKLKQNQFTHFSHALAPGDHQYIL